MKKLDPLHHISIIEPRGTNCAWVRIKYDNKIYRENWPFTKFSPRKVSPLNSSGEIGVSYSESDHAWVATWQENSDGVRRQRNAYFSINKYGDKKARTMAIQRRRAEVENNKISA